MSDGELIARSIHDPEQFAPLFDRHAAVVHHYLGRRLGPQADDLLSETFLIAFRRRGSYRPDHVDARPWLFGIANNLVRRHARAERRRYAALARVPRDGPTTTDDTLDDRLDASRLRPLLAGALASLTAADRETLLLQAWAGLTYPEIADALDVPVGTVRSRLNRARTQLRAALPHPDLPEICEDAR